MNNNRRRNFRGRQQKNGFRRRPTSTHASNGHFSNNNIGNKNFNRNGSLSNPSSIEKIISKFQQLAKDAQSNGDPVQAQNYLQHADHYLRRLNELIEKKEHISEKSKINEKTSSEENTLENKSSQSNN